MLPSPEDPGQYFRESPYLVTTDVDSGSTPPRLLRTNVGSNLGALLTLFVGAVSGASGDTLRATISVALSLKE